jgi:hypothetical protein
VKSTPATSGTLPLEGLSPAPPRRDFFIILGVWAGLALALFWLGRQNTSVPGLYYDEAVFGGMAKDFVTGQTHGQHMPNREVAELFGRPFPVFVQPYLGALKSWLLMPAFSLFGPSLSVLRLTNLAWGLVGLLFFMIWCWQLLGPWEAVVAGSLLALDPTFFFLAWLDWGAVMPSLVCRFLGFLLVLLAWRKRRASLAFFAGVIFGLGFFSKIDFAVILTGTALAGLCAFAQPLIALVRARPAMIAWPILGFFIGTGPMRLMFPTVLRLTLTDSTPAHPGELNEKFNTLRAMYNGSYFHRLMDAGGLFDKMQQISSPVWTPLGIVLLIAGFLVAVNVIRARPGDAGRRARVFLLLALGLVTLGVLLLPGAVRIHHAALVVPFPHLIIAVAGADLWRHFWKRRAAQPIVRALLGAGLVTLLLWQTRAIDQTEQLIRETRGRGWWSDALVNFCREIKNRADLTIVSLDWGFNEQLNFLTDGPRLQEPIWGSSEDAQTALLKDPNCVFLVHAPEYSLFPLGTAFRQSAALEARPADIQPWRDAQGRIVFYSIRFPAR